MFNSDIKGFTELMEKRFNELCKINIFGTNLKDLEVEKILFKKSWPQLPILGVIEPEKFFDLETEILEKIGLDHAKELEYK